MLKAALAALTFTVEYARAVMDPADLAAYPTFAARMAALGTKFNMETEWTSFDTWSFDGYKQTLWRITGNNQEFDPATATRGPIMLVAGIWDSPMDFVQDEPCDTVTGVCSQDLPLALHLFNSGFDVFIANHRGDQREPTAPSQESQLYTRDQPEFWDFSFQEVGEYDVEAMVGGIVAQRNGYCQQVTVLGHGTSASAAMISNSKNISNQVYQDEVDRIVALSPCGVVTHESMALGNEDLSTLNMFASTIETLFETTQYFGPYFKDELLASPVPTGMDPVQFG